MIFICAVMIKSVSLNQYDEYNMLLALEFRSMVIFLKTVHKRMAKKVVFYSFNLHS